ncbi:MAG: energy-coupling factor ABC transporter permease [Coriobacteriia bacterium]|nr:energy-coupling factor ABC transporter permease [Coriobacteriia bacterium]
MHMADALLSPAVGATMWAATAVTTVYCAKKVREENDAARIPLMGVAGAFIFASQMLNFTIPGTGSSGHLGGGLILAILLGPHAAFIVMASVLTVQALFFGDGGLLALGSNIFNLGFFPAFVAYPFIYKPIAGDATSKFRVVSGAIIAAVAALQLGSFAVVLQTLFSGISALPFTAFLALMQPIHLAIGIVEGFVTGAVVFFVSIAQPELLTRTSNRDSVAGLRLRTVIVGLAIAAVVAGGLLSWFASPYSDGLEWSIEKVAGTAELEAPAGVHAALAEFQGLTAVLPDYAFPTDGAQTEEVGAASGSAVDVGTTTSGLVGAGAVLLIAVGAGFALRRRKGGPPADPAAS